MATAAATAAAIIDPSEHDSNLIWFTFLVFVVGASLGLIGAVSGAPIAWALSWFAMHRGNTALN